MKVAVYTAIFGNKDEAPELLNGNVELSDEFDFICITDNPNLKSSSYKIIQTTAEFPDLAKNARKIKINGFKEIERYDVAIWHDSSIQMNGTKLSELTEFASDHILSTFHHRRYCTYLEAIECINHRKDSPGRIALQMWKYFRQGFPSNFRLHETGIMVLSRAYFQSELKTVWWNEVRTQTRRDQLSLAYARWKTDTEIGLLEGITGTGTDNRFSTWIGHRYSHYIDAGFLKKMDSPLIRGICKKLIYEMRCRR